MHLQFTQYFFTKNLISLRNFLIEDCMKFVWTLAIKNVTIFTALALGIPCIVHIKRFLNAHMKPRYGKRRSVIMDEWRWQLPTDWFWWTWTVTKPRPQNAFQLLLFCFENYKSFLDPFIISNQFISHITENTFSSPTIATIIMIKWENANVILPRWLLMTTFVQHPQKFFFSVGFLWTEALRPEIWNQLRHYQFYVLHLSWHVISVLMINNLRIYQKYQFLIQRSLGWTLFVKIEPF